MLEIVRMGMERRDRIAEIWADAFEQDPLMKWVFPDDAARLECLTRWWGFCLDHLPPALRCTEPGPTVAWPTGSPLRARTASQRETTRLIEASLRAKRPSSP